jgi:hypothetical protein
LGAGNARVEDREGVFDIVGGEEIFRKLEDPFAGFGVDIDVGDEVFILVARSEGLHGCLDFFYFGSDGGYVFRGGLIGWGGLLRGKKGDEEEGEESLHE